MNLPGLPDYRATCNRYDACIADEHTTLSNGGDFAQRVRATATQLHQLGVVPGSVVAVQLRNRVELIVVLFAGWRLGAAVTPVNPNLTDFETEHQLRDSGAVVLVGDARPLPSFDGAYLDVADLATTVDVGAPDSVHNPPTGKSWRC